MFSKIKQPSFSHSNFLTRCECRTKSSHESPTRDEKTSFLGQIGLFPPITMVGCWPCKFINSFLGCASIIMITTRHGNHPTLAKVHYCFSYRCSLSFFTLSLTCCVSFYNCYLLPISLRLSCILALCILLFITVGLGFLEHFWRTKPPYT